MFDVWQVHSAEVVMARAPRNTEEDYEKADVILTDRPEVTLFMRFADCVPVLLYDPVQAVIGMVHAGWLGTVRGASRVAVDAMVAEYGSRPADILAGIGPSIGVDHYEVGADVLAQVKLAFGAAELELVQRRDGKTYLDLWAANRVQLGQAGIEQIEIAGLCTACHTDDWFSHRGENGKTGRFGALIALPN
jgi:YfiH family protein